MSSRKFSHLTPDQKSQIVVEFEKNATEEKSPSYQYIANWAAEKFKLNPVPNSFTIFRIIRNKNISKRRGKKVKSEKLEKALNSWVWEMYEKGIAVTDSLIQEKASRLLAAINQDLQNSKKVSMKFSNGCLSRFKKRNKFKR